MLGTEDGTVVVMKHGPIMEKLAINDLKNAVYTTPVASNGVLYITNRRSLFSIALTK